MRGKGLAKVKTNQVYKAFGLTIISDVSLTGLELGGGTPDITVRYGAVPETLADATSMGLRFQVAPDRFLLKVDGVARYMVSNGQEIMIEPCPSAKEHDIRVFLLGSVLGALLQQRGDLVLHGAAVVVNNHGIILSGVSGVGKSTLAAALSQKGYLILTDDVSVIRCSTAGSSCIIPGYPRLKLWADSAEKIGNDTNSLQQVRGELGKFDVPLTEEFCQTPVPLRCLYQLNISDSTSVQIVRDNGVQKLETLMKNTYRYRFLDGKSGKALHLKQCVAVAKTIDICQIMRPRKGFLLDELVAVLENDWDIQQAKEKCC